MNEVSERVKFISIEPYCYDLFTDKMIAAIDTKTPHLIHQYNKIMPDGSYTRQFCKVLFLGYTCTVEEVPDIMNILANKLNELAEKDFIMASLTTMAVIPFVEPSDPLANGLHCSINGKRMYGVVSYLAIHEDGEKYIKEYMPYLEMPEGGTPKICTNEPLDHWESFHTYAISEE